MLCTFNVELEDTDLNSIVEHLASKYRVTGRLGDKKSAVYSVEYFPSKRAIITQSGNSVLCEIQGGISLLRSECAVKAVQGFLSSLNGAQSCSVF